jgi:uncharacterized protein YecE (DUF72 family)
MPVRPKTRAGELALAGWRAVALKSASGSRGWRYPGWRGKFYPPGLPHQPSDARLVMEGKTDNKSRDVFVYFDNDAKVHAPFDAIRLL